MLQLGPLVFNQAHRMSPASTQIQYGRWVYRTEATNQGPVVRRQYRGLTVVTLRGNLPTEFAAQSSLLRRVIEVRGDTTRYNASIQGYYLSGEAYPLAYWDHRRDVNGNHLIPRHILGQFFVADFNVTEGQKNVEHAENLEWDVTLVEVREEGDAT